MGERGISKRYIITSAQACATPHATFLKGLETLLEKSGAPDGELIVLPLMGKNAEEDWLEDQGLIHQDLQGYLQPGQQRLNNNIGIRQYYVKPQQIDPLAGLDRFTRETNGDDHGRSVIFASPKQRLRTVPHSHVTIPRFIATTGACTYPRYAIDEQSGFDRRRLANIAQRDHVYGALVVDVVDKTYFHFRNIRATREGVFSDLATTYEGKMRTKAYAAALILGDWHNGVNDPEVVAANYDMIRRLKPKRLFLHDFFNGHSVSFRDKQFVSGFQLEESLVGKTSLEKELTQGYQELLKISKAMEGCGVYVVPSNHHDFLMRWLDRREFANDSENFAMGTKIFVELLKDPKREPLEVGLRLIGKIPTNVKFLSRTEDYKVHGYQLAAHGDKGRREGRGALTDKEKDLGASVSGHVHSAEILRETYTVGTALPLDMFYARGEPLKWTHTNAAINSRTGKVQLIHIIDGNWYAPWQKF